MDLLSIMDQLIGIHRPAGVNITVVSPNILQRCQHLHQVTYHQSSGLRGELDRRRREHTTPS